MPQRQWRSDDTDQWVYGFGTGSDGAYSSSGNATDAPIDSSCSGTSGATSLTATNASFAAGQFILIHQSRGTGAGNWELNRISSYTSGTITTSHALMNTYTDSGASQAQVLVVKQYTTFTQNSGHTLTAKAWDGNVGGIIAFFCSGKTTIAGTFDCAGATGGGSPQGGTGGGATSGAGFDGGNGRAGISSYNSFAFSGEGTANSSQGSNAANGNGGGGGGLSGPASSAGAGGGHGTTGGNGGGSLGSTGGSTAGVAALTTMVFGGGGGGSAKDGPLNYANGGGSGGGIVAIFSNDLVITGSITTTGGQGGQANVGGTRGGGGGAGGSILLKTQTATLGTNLLLSTGGAGGSAQEGTGGAGGVGRIHIDYSSSFTGTTNPTIDSRLDSTIIPLVSNKNYFYFM